MRLAWAFFVRDARIATSYRISFFAQLLGNLLVIGLFYFIGKVIGSQPLPALKAYGGNFLAYLLIGIALTDCVGVSLFTFASQIREAQTTGTLEATLISPARLPMILVYSSIWNYFLSAVRFIIYLVAGGFVYGVDLSHSSVPAAIAVFLLTVFCFMGVGMLWAGAVMIVKRGESIITLGGTVVLLFSGVVFPPTVLPSWMQSLAQAIPLTPALDGMRHALLQGYGFHELRFVLLHLSVFAVVLMAAGMYGFGRAVDLGKRTGSLTQY